MFTCLFSYPGRLFWKVDGISSGLDLQAQVYLPLDLYFSEFCIHFTFLIVGLVVKKTNLVLKFELKGSLMYRCNLSVAAGGFLQLWLVCQKWRWSSRTGMQRLQQTWNCWTRYLFCLLKLSVHGMLSYIWWSTQGKYCICHISMWNRSSNTICYGYWT